MENTIAYRQAKRQVERKVRFVLHLAIYLAVNAALILAHSINHDTPLWSFGPVIGWGIGVLFHGLSVALRAPNAGWKQRMIRAELNKNH
jgi:hypothetical protein